MVQRIGGARRKSRHKLAKSYRQKGKTAIRKILQEFKEGDRVVLKAEPSVQGGIYNLRYHGSTGKIMSRQGSCYNVQVPSGKGTKTFIVHPVHLKRVKE